MDWLTADLVLKSIATVIGLWILCWICGSALCLLVSEDAPELRARIRMRWRRKWKPRELTRLEALSLTIANGQTKLPPATKYRVDVLNGVTADADEGQGDPLRIVRPSAG